MNRQSSSIARFIAALSSVLLFADSAGAQSEPYRPAFHFTPEKNWMNDPNGMVYYEGEWHLFYQYNPFGNQWGHMSWGHAVSRDLMRWEHLPLALPEADGVMIFSGSAVIDWKNSSGFGVDGKPPMVAIYTGHRQGRQDQRIAYSNDRGRTWTKYESNPVLDLNMADFRDPKVFWHDVTSQWVMTITLPVDRKVHFYGSPDLKNWKLLSEFGPAGSTDGVWECPDLFPVAVEGARGTTKWVLVVNISNGAPSGGSGCQYFVGEFDGKKFTADPLPPHFAEHVPNGKTIADFDGEDYGGWKVEGDAFGKAPARGTLPRQQAVSGFHGRGLVNSYHNGDGTQGTLTSPAFEIDAPWLSFLVGGGAHKDETCMNLLVDGKVVRTATGDERERLNWKSWDVKELIGKQAVLQIVDRRTDGWGHINIDRIILASEPARPARESALWADHGPDFYAAVSWSDVPESDGRRIWIGWMSDVHYAGSTPTHPWRSAMTVPRSLAVRRTPDGFRLVQTPVKELESLAQGEAHSFAGGTFAQAAEWLAGLENLPELLEVELNFSLPEGAAPFTFEVKTGEGESTLVACDPAAKTLSVDRSKSGRTDFHRAFAARRTAPIRVTEGELRLRLLLDRSSLEVFAQGGETVLTHLIYPSPGARALRLQSAEGKASQVKSIRIQALQVAR